MALSKFIVIRPDLEKVDPVFLLIFLQSQLGREQFNHFIRGMSAQIYPFDIQNVVISIPPLDEQRSIAASFKGLLERYFKLAKNIDNTKEQLNSIRPY